MAIRPNVLPFHNVEDYVPSTSSIKRDSKLIFDRYISHEGIRTIPSKQSSPPQTSKSFWVMELIKIQFPNAINITPLSDVKKPASRRLSDQPSSEVSLTGDWITFMM